MNRKPPDWCKKIRDCEARCDNCPESEMTDKCPSCEYNKLRAEMWREEAYRQAGTPLPEPRREWVGLTDEEIKKLFRQSRQPGGAVCRSPEQIFAQHCRAIEVKLREKNT